MSIFPKLEPTSISLHSLSFGCFCSGHPNPLIIDRFSRGFLFPKCTKSVLNAKVYCQGRSQKERNVTSGYQLRFIMDIETLNKAHITNEELENCLPHTHKTKASYKEHRNVGIGKCFLYELSGGILCIQKIRMYYPSSNTFSGLCRFVSPTGDKIEKMYIHIKNIKIAHRISERQYNVLSDLFNQLNEGILVFQSFERVLNFLKTYI